MLDGESERVRLPTALAPERVPAQYFLLRPQNKNVVNSELNILLFTGEKMALYLHLRPGFSSVFGKI